MLMMKRRMVDARATYGCEIRDGRPARPKHDVEQYPAIASNGPSRRPRHGLRTCCKIPIALLPASQACERFCPNKLTTCLPLSREDRNPHRHRERNRRNERDNAGPNQDIQGNLFQCNVCLQTDAIDRREKLNRYPFYTQNRIGFGGFQSNATSPKIFARDFWRVSFSCECHVFSC